MNNAPYFAFGIKDRTKCCATLLNHVMLLRVHARDYFHDAPEDLDSRMLPTACYRTLFTWFLEYNLIYLTVFAARKTFKATDHGKKYTSTSYVTNKSCILNVSNLPCKNISATAITGCRSVTQSGIPTSSFPLSEKRAE